MSIVSGGIRTHAPEETGALIQHLRPLGHATIAGWPLGAMCYKYNADEWRLFIDSSKQDL